ncbi:MAG: response regulator [Sphingomonas bacterium]
MTGRVVLIEDNPMHGKLYCAALQASGFLPHHVLDPMLALSEIANSDAAAVIVDIRLPHMDGRTIIRQVREDRATRLLPIVAVSAFADQGTEETCLDAGADRFRAKPVRLATLARDIKQLIKARETRTG